MAGSSPKNLTLGLRVVRTDSMASGHPVGTIRLVGDSETVYLYWDNGEFDGFLRTPNGRFALRVVDSSPAGVVHENCFCHVCGQNSPRVIAGFRFRCSVCSDYNLCTSCYMNFSDAVRDHQPSHPFYRIDFADSPGVRLPCRTGSTTTPLLGIYKGSLVKPSRCWTLPEQRDGVGLVESTGALYDPPDGSGSVLLPSGGGVAVVNWLKDDGERGRYANGFGGKIDLEGVKLVSGGAVFLEHLPLLGTFGFGPEHEEAPTASVAGRGGEADTASQVDHENDEVTGVPTALLIDVDVGQRTAMTPETVGAQEEREEMTSVDELSTLDADREMLAEAAAQLDQVADAMEHAQEFFEQMLRTSDDAGEPEEEEEVALEVHDEEYYFDDFAAQGVELLGAAMPNGDGAAAENEMSVYADVRGSNGDSTEFEELDYTSAPHTRVQDPCLSPVTARDVQGAQGVNSLRRCADVTRGRSSRGAHSSVVDAGGRARDIADGAMQSSTRTACSSVQGESSLAGRTFGKGADTGGSSPLRLPHVRRHAIVDNATFVAAIKEGRCDEVHDYIRRFPEQVDRRVTLAGQTALHVACATGAAASAVVQFLVALDANPNVIDSAGRTPLHCAVWPGRSDQLVRILCHKNSKRVSTNVNVQDFNGLTPLHLACKTAGLETCVKALAEHDAVRMNVQDTVRQQTAVHFAARWGSKEVVDALLVNEKCTVAEVDVTDKWGMNPLHVAAYFGNDAFMGRARQRFPHVIDVPASDGEPIQRGGASLEGQTPLHIAASMGHIRMTLALVNTCKANTEARETRRHRTPLHLAVQRRRVFIVEFLLRGAGVNPIAVDCEGNSVLHYAGASLSHALRGLRPDGARADGGPLRVDAEVVEKLMSVRNRDVTCEELLQRTTSIELVIVLFLLLNGANHRQTNSAGLPALNRSSEACPPLVECFRHYSELGLARARKLCNNCQQRVREVRFDPCGHAVLCKRCATRSRACCICWEAATKTDVVTGETVSDDSPVASVKDEAAKMVATLESRLRDLETIVTCPICYENHRDMVFSCGHAVCSTCFAKLTGGRCPSCRQAIRTVTRVYDN